MLSALAVCGYRSLRDFVIPLDRLNLVTGPNGSGKSNLYRSLRLLAEIAQGRAIPLLAREGGLQSTLWAGPESISRAMIRGDHPVEGTSRTKPVRLRLGFSGEDFSYAIDLGLPPPPLLRLATIRRSSGSACGPGGSSGRRRFSSTGEGRW